MSASAIVLIIYIMPNPVDTMSRVDSQSGYQISYRFWRFVESSAGSLLALDKSLRFLAVLE